MQSFIFCDKILKIYYTDFILNAFRGSLNCNNVLKTGNILVQKAVGSVDLKDLYQTAALPQTPKERSIILYL